jgi:uncharacterized protein (TIGR03435 family)
MRMLMKSRERVFVAVMLAAVGVLLRGPATVAAQSANAANLWDGRAHLSLVQGTVQFQPAGGGDKDWMAAGMDRTLKIGDQLWADTDGAVEMNVGSTAVRMGHNTGISFLNLSENVIQLQVSAGSVIVRLRELDPNGAFEVSAPNLALALLQPGTYEIDADPDAHVTVVTALAGAGQATGGGQSWNVTPGQQATFSGTDTIEYSVKDAKSIAETEFEKWSAQRDAKENHAAAESAHNVAAEAAPTLPAPVIQAPAEDDWQKAAGGKQAFDVASVKENKSGAPPSGNTPVSNVDFGPGTIFSPTGGLFSATNWTLFDYLRFAYKLNIYQRTTLAAEAPKWVVTNRYDIQARADGNPTKDQVRMMMQSLLADRFKLAVHTETRELPEYALDLVKPGKTGPQLQAYSANAPCTSTPTTYLPGNQTQLSGPSGFPTYCGGVGFAQASVPGRARLGGQNVTMAFIASSFTIPFLGLDRPVVDRTGLSGNFDFVIEFTPQVDAPLPAGVNFEPDPAGPTFQEALKEQAGLKLDAATGPVDVVVFDHAEAPTEN